MRAAFRGLTLRGRSLLAAGVAVAVCALVLDQRDLLRVAALLVAVPTVAALLLARRDDRLGVARTLEPARVPVGHEATVRLRLQNTGAGRSGPLLVTDQIDPTLGSAPNLVVERLDPGERVETSYRVDTTVRGRHQVGPLALTLEDPFGMVQTTRSSSTIHSLTVTPVVVPLSQGPFRASSGGTGDGQSRRTAAAGHDDVGTREYRSGDELRRVHWRSTARTGALMVRQEEEPWEAQALVVLDTRLLAHARSARSAPAGVTTSSFEWAVSAAASVAAHLARSERRVRVVAGRTDLTITGGSTGTMLDALAAVRTNRDGLLVPSGTRHTSAPVVVAVLGAMDARDVGEVSALRATATTGVAIVIDTATWSPDGHRAPARSELSAPLLAHGWHAAVVGRGDDVADVWDRVSR